MGSSCSVPVLIILVQAVYIMTDTVVAVWEKPVPKANRGTISNISLIQTCRKD